MRASTLVATVAVIAAMGALLSLFSRGASDAPRSLSVERTDPLTAAAPATDPAVLAGIRRSAEVAAADATSGDGAPTRAAEAPVAPSVEASQAGRAIPEALLLVDVVQLDGAAVAGAVVQLELVSVGPTGAERPSLERATTDARGRASFELSDLDRVRAAGVVARLEASASGGTEHAPRGAPRLTSALVRLETPLHAPLHAPLLARPVRLVVDAPALVVVRVSTQGGAPLLFVDEYEPRVIEVPFGTRELVFRRTRTVPYEPVVFDVVDASTGQLVPDVLVMTYRADAPGDYAFHNAQDGHAQPRCSLHADTTCLLEAPGYRRRALLAVELAATAPGGDVPRVTLEPGVLRELRVVDTTGRAVVGAVVSRGPHALGATDAAGRFLVDLETSPEAGLTITAGEHAPSTWRPRDGFADLGPAEVVLEPR